MEMLEARICGDLPEFKAFVKISFVQVDNESVSKEFQFTLNDIFGCFKLLFKYVYNVAGIAVTRRKKRQKKRRKCGI